MRVRFRFSKLGKVRFTSHRDVARLWERALRRAALPVASTEGFSPRPKVHFGLALSTGHESLGEYLDVDLLEPDAVAVDLVALPAQLSALLPPGLDVASAVVVDRTQPSLQEAVSSCSWRIEVPGVAPDVLRAATRALLDRDTLPVERERKGKPVHDDLRPGIVALHVADDGVLEAELATQPRGVRPSELLDALAPFVAEAAGAGTTLALDESRVCRTHQWIVLDGARREPLPLDATGAPHAHARAS